jgi:hypothetical protein
MGVMTHHPDGWRRIFAGTTAVALSFLAGCMSTPTGPITFGPSEAPSAWAVLKWRIEQSPTDLDAQSKLEQAEQVVFAEWVGDLAKRFTFVSREAQTGRPRLDGSRAGSMKPSELLAALGALDVPITVAASKEQCLGFGWARGWQVRDGRFAQWFDLNKNGLCLGAPYDDQRRQLQTEFRQAAGELAERLLTDIQGLIDKREHGKAFESMKAARPALAGTGKEGSLEALMQGVAAHLVLADIAKVREAGYDTPENNLRTEKELYARRDAWQADQDLVNAFAAAESQAEFAKLQKDIGFARGKHWQQELQDLAGKKYYWTMHLQQQRRLAEAGGLEPAVGVGVSAALWEKYTALLPDAFAHFVATAKKERADADRHGLAIILCTMVYAMDEHVTLHGKSLPTAAREELVETRRIEAESSAAVKERFFKRRLYVEDFDPKGGAGTEFKIDLDATFGDELLKNALLYGITIGETRENQEPETQDYVVFKGIYPEVEAEYARPVEEHRIEKRRGETVSAVNPQYAEAVSRGKSTAGIPESIWKQKVYSFTIKKTTTKATASARVRYSLRHKGKTEALVIDMGALRKEFTGETLEGLLTKVEEEILGAAPSVEVSVSPEEDVRRTLVVAEIPSLIELRKWAREEVKQLAVMRVLHLVASYPMELADQAGTFGKEDRWSGQAADFSGVVFDYLRRTHPEEGTKSRYFQYYTPDGSSAEPPAYLKADFSRNAELMRTLGELKKSSWNSAVDAVLKYLEKSPSIG